MADKRLLEGVDIFANVSSHRRRQCWGLELPEPLQLPDVLASSTEDDISFLLLAKGVQTRGPDTPFDAFVSFAF